MHKYARVLGIGIGCLLFAVAASANPHPHNPEPSPSSEPSVVTVDGGSHTTTNNYKRSAPSPASFYNTSEDQNGISVTTPMGTVSATKKDLYAQKRDHWLLLQDRCDNYGYISVSGGKCQGPVPLESCVHRAPVCDEADAARVVMNDQMKWNEPNLIVKLLGKLVGFTGVRGFIDQ